MGYPCISTCPLCLEDMANRGICSHYISIRIILPELNNALLVTSSRPRWIRFWEQRRPLHPSNERHRWVQRVLKKDTGIRALETPHDLTPSLLFPNSLWIFRLPDNVALTRFLLHVHDHLLMSVQDWAHDPLQIYPFRLRQKEVLVRQQTQVRRWQMKLLTTIKRNETHCTY